MTSIVGVLCEDGVVIGADSSVTFGDPRTGMTIEQPFQKLELVWGKVILASTGQIGLGQRFNAVINKQWNNVFRESPVEIDKAFSRTMIEDMLFTHINANNGLYGAIVAFPASNKLHLCEFALADFQPELKSDRLWYCSMGSAQRITDPFLAFMRNVFWQDGRPTLHGGIFAVTWTLQHAIETNTGGVNGPIQIAVLEPERKNPTNPTQARILSAEELEEHKQNIDEAKKALRDFQKQQQPTAASNIPPIPKP